MNSPTSKKLLYTSIKRDPDQKDHDPVLVENFRRLQRNRIYYDDFTPVARMGDFQDPWHIHVGPELRCPTLHNDSPIDFEQACDIRAQEVLSLIQQQDLPCLIYWSGGIDSTVILAAMIRNWPRWAKQRIVVVMNNCSYYENPVFYDRVIKDNQIRCENQDRTRDWTNSFVISGLLADPLWVQADIVEIEAWQPGCSRLDPAKRPETLLSWLLKKTDAANAEWFYNLVMANSVSAGIELHTYEDFYWWWNFNFMFTCQAYKLYACINDHNLHLARMDTYRSNYISWYNNSAYQIWSYQNRNNGAKYRDSIRSYKMPAKRYIFSVDHNAWYRDYKTKTGSSHAPFLNNVNYVYTNGDFGFRHGSGGQFVDHISS